VSEAHTTTRGPLTAAPTASVPEGKPACFAIRVYPQRDAACVVPAGELDIATVDQLGEQVLELSDAGFHRVVVDLRELTFIDLSAVRLLCELAATARADGWQLELIQGRAAVRRLLVFTETLALLPFTTTAQIGRSSTAQIRRT
jgi:anti-anti-sigma factor